MQWRLLDPLDDEQRRTVLARTRRRRYRRGEVVFHEGDPGDTLHLIERGHVAIKRATPLGDVAALVVLGPGDQFGELAVLGDGHPRSSTVQALDAVETLTLHRDQFEELRRAHPAIDGILVMALAADVRRLSDRLLEALYVPVTARVYRRLAELAHIYGDADIPLTQDDLAGLAGTSRPSANKALRTAEAAGLVEVGRGRVTIVDLDELARRGGT
jgi:CRP/FNR family transcriptional regulator, cyclic AMP receptor protein